MVMKMYKQGEVSEVSDTLMAKEKPQAGMLKKYSSGELSNVADGVPAKENHKLKC